jgi:GNAT superfamily N-acetyltransferase
MSSSEKNDTPEWAVAGEKSRGGDVSVEEVDLERVRLWRDMYRLEMSCQITKDSIHERSGWTREYLLSMAGAPVGYGSVAVGGPWAGQPTLYEFYVAPTKRLRLFDLFRALLVASGAAHINVQTNDTLATVMLHAFATDVKSMAILFHDKITTSFIVTGATFRQPTASEEPDIPDAQRRWRGVIDLGGEVVANGGILFHYNRPFGDIYMEVAEGYRRRGFGSFLVQELKRVCYQGGHVPAARCNPDNIASQRTLQKAGFVPCGHILSGAVIVPTEHATRG